MNQHLWYNCISSIYDYFTVFPYQKVRLEAISKLNIASGDTVIDLGSGTGLNLEKLSQLVGKDGLVIAVEPSKGMLNQARKKAENFTFKNVLFVEKNISEYVRSDEFIKVSKPNLKVISVLVISVIPNWKEDLRALIRALPNDSQFLIMDLFSKKKNIVTFCIDKIAQSDTSRKSWSVLEETSSDSLIWWYKIPLYFGIKAFIAMSTIKNA